jgi:hypothetical protein
MMSAHLTNPYARNTPEHMLWARWHRNFFDQPVHRQLMAIESQLRQTLSALLQMNANVTPSDIRSEMRSCLLEVEESVDLLNEAAEHAFVRLVSEGAESVAP